MSLLLVLEGIAGAVLILAILQDVFLSVVVPRRAPNVGRMFRPSAFIIPALWRVWRELGLRMTSPERREAVLRSFGSLAVMLLLGAWGGGSRPGLARHPRASPCWRPTRWAAS